MPVTLPLGGKEPATLEGRFTASGYTLQLTGSATAEDLLALGNAIPALGDGLKERLDEAAKSAPHGNPSDRLALPSAPFQVDLAATRAWGGAQVWSDVTVRPPAGRRHHSADR
jgi:AsmA protein